MCARALGKMRDPLFADVCWPKCVPLDASVSIHAGLSFPAKRRRVHGCTCGPLRIGNVQECVCVLISVCVPECSRVGSVFEGVCVCVSGWERDGTCVCPCFSCVWCVQGSGLCRCLCPEDTGVVSVRVYLCFIRGLASVPISEHLDVVFCIRV